MKETHGYEIDFLRVISYDSVEWKRLLVTNNFLSNKSRVNKNHHYWGDKLLSISKKVIPTMDLDKNW